VALTQSNSKVQEWRETSEGGMIGVTIVSFGLLLAVLVCGCYHTKSRVAGRESPEFREALPDASTREETDISRALSATTGVP